MFLEVPLRMPLLSDATDTFNEPRWCRSFMGSSENLFTLQLWLLLKATFNKCQAPNISKQFLALIKFQRGGTHHEVTMSVKKKQGLRLRNGTLNKWSISLWWWQYLFPSLRRTALSLHVPLIQMLKPSLVQRITAKWLFHCTYKEQLWEGNWWNCFISVAWLKLSVHFIDSV